MEGHLARRYGDSVAMDHACPVAWASEHGFLDDSPVEASWCLSYRREALLALAEVDARAAGLLLWRKEGLSIYYAPFDWVNRGARVMLVGITPGLHQATEALREARRCLRAGQPNEAALRSAGAVGSFAGAMRSNLVGMLDGIGFRGALDIDSAAQLFGTHHHLAAHVSAITFPVFVGERNYSGGSPPLTKHPILRALVKALLGAQAAMAPEALVVPLGTAAQGAVQLLIDRDLLSRDRCLLGLPHPSSANGWRARQYSARQRTLQADLARWARTV